MASVNVSPSFNNGKKLRLFFASKRDAEKKRAELLSYHEERVSDRKKQQLAERGMTIPDAIDYAIAHAPVVADMTMGKLIKQYVGHRVEELGISERYRASLASYVTKLTGAFGEVDLRDITTGDLREFLRSLKNRAGNDAASASKRNHYIEVLQAAFNYAKREGYLTVSPAAKLDKKADESEGGVSILSITETAAILEALTLPEHADIAPAVLIQLFAAPRRSEVMHIR